MHYLTVLNQTVNANLSRGKVGTPVFVRWTASVAATKDTLRLLGAEMAAYTGQWLAAGLRRVYATGAEGQGHLALTLEYDNGSAGVVGLTLAHDRPHMALAIYGSHGAIYHYAYIAPTRDGVLTPNQADARADALLAAIEQSLAGGQPVALVQAGGEA